VNCLNCHKKMIEQSADTRRGQVDYDVCEACGSIWFDMGELDAMVPQVFESVETASRDAAAGISEPPPRRCPRCEPQLLDKVFFLRYSDILLDHCSNCHGFWLDGGELDRINEELRGIKAAKDHGPVVHFVVRL